MRSRTRLLAAAGALVVFGAIIGVTQISNADDQAGSPAQTTAGKTVNGLEILANDCAGSALEPHDGFQKGDRCVSTQFGEVGAAANNPSLLIVEAPRSVEAGKPFTLKVSTRNLIRDRFLAAGKGGYYVESSVLRDGIVRGHFHTACRSLSSTRVAPDPAPVPAFFVATEDQQGGRTPDTVSIQVAGIKDVGAAQCASWAGDGSHRIPMMERANQTPAFDAVRIQVRPGQDQSPAEQSPAEQPPAQQPPAQQPPAEKPPAGTSDSGSGDNPPAVAPPGQPRTDSDTVKRNPPAAAPAGTDDSSSSSRTNSTSNSASSNSTSNSASSNSSSSEREESTSAQAATGNRNAATGGSKKAVAPETAESEAAGAALAGDDGAPDPEPQGVEPAAAQTPEQDKLALTGSSTLAVIAGGVVVALIGFVVLSATRRRRPRASHYYQ